jgi:transposase
VIHSEYLERLEGVSHSLRPNYAQRFLLPPALEDWVPEDHPVRFVRDFVDTLDLRQLGIEESMGDEGRPAYAPDLLLKVWLFGYMERIRSTRGLEKACLQVMPFLWLTGNLHPDHNTLWRFFKKHRAALPKLFKQLVQTAAKAELIGFALHALDGTKMGAVSSTDEALHRQGLQEKLKRIDEFITAYLKEVTTRSDDDKGAGYTMPAAMTNAAARRARIHALLEQRIEDREDKEKASRERTSEPQARAAETPTRDEEPPRGSVAVRATPLAATTDPVLREAQTVKTEIKDHLGKLDAAGVNHLHEQELEARMMKGRGATHALGYNAQIVVDQDSDLIVACTVVNEQTDLTQLVPMLDRVHATFGEVAKQTVADTGYANSDHFRSAEASEWPILVSLRDEPEKKGEYSKAYFRYDAVDNVYVCPRGERLLQIGTNKSHATTKHADAIYRCTNTTCPVRSQCTTDPLGRKVRRQYGEDARERQAQKQEDPRMRLLLGLRKEIVEHLFGIVKGIDGFRRFTVRGLEKAEAQWALVCTAVNLRKLSAKATWKAGRLVLRALDPQTVSPSAWRA